MNQVNKNSVMTTILLWLLIFYGYATNSIAEERPPGNTGNGLFAVGSKIYDANGLITDALKKAEEPDIRSMENAECAGDSDADLDVDGADLYAWVVDLSPLELSVFAGEFGNAECDGNSSGNEHPYSEVFTGGKFHLGPVEWNGNIWNAFAPYPKNIQQIEGNLLAGVETSHWKNVVDACIKVETERGKSAILRVVTYGITSTNSIDVSPEAYDILNSGYDDPRNMSWYIAKCPDNGENIYYQFKAGSNQWWAAFWVRNVALPVKTVEVKKGNSQWRTLTTYEAGDGSLVDEQGYGNGSYAIRVTAIDGSYVEDTLSPESGGLYPSSGQF